MTGPVYPAKVLLFGEHTVLRGGKGLAVPYPAFHLRWARAEGADSRLIEFARYAKEAQFPLDHARLLSDLEAGLRLPGNIPTGYGLGSSGAVCAAVYDRYGPPRETQRLRQLRDRLASLEGFFHGSSSGTDPLVSYLKEPLHLRPGSGPQAVVLPAGWSAGWFLVDTGVARDASALIRRFLDAHDREPDAIRQGWRQPADRAIEALIAGDTIAVYRNLVRVSEFQRARFPTFIPPDFRGRWDGGEAYRLKLCGAGGGGMILGLARDRGATTREFGEGIRWLDAPPTGE